MVVIHRQQVSLAVLQPAPGGTALALRTVPVAAGVVGDLDLCAVFTAQQVTTERGTAAALNGRHHLQLAETQMPGTGITPRRSMVAEDVRDLQAATRRSGGWQRQVFQRTGHLAERAGCHVAVACGGLQLAVTQQHLDHADIDLVLQQVGGKAVTQGVHGDPLVQFGQAAAGVRRWRVY